jgi:SAM-dependent methyltransferase
VISDDAGRRQVCGARYAQRRAEGKPGWSDENSYALAQQEIRRILALGILPQRFRFLELGCGNGSTALSMAAAGHKVCGIDLVPEAIDWARAQAAERKLRAEFSVGSVVTLEPYRDTSFDLVFDAGCLIMIVGGDRERCVRNVFRVLKPGGVFHAEANLLSDAVRGRVTFAGEEYFDPDGQYSTVQGLPMYYYSREQEFRDLLTGAGFTIIREEKEPPYPGHEQMTFCAGGMRVVAVKREKIPGETRHISTSKRCQGAANIVHRCVVHPNDALSDRGRCGQRCTNTAESTDTAVGRWPSSPRI